MREFGKIYTRYWAWVKENEVDHDTALIGAYLLSNDHSNSLGCYRLPHAYAADDLNYPIDTLSKGYNKLSEKGFMAYCDVSQYVFLPKYIKWNKLENPKHAIGTMKAAIGLPSSCTLSDQVVEAIKKYGNQVKLKSGEPLFEHKDVKSLFNTLCDRLSIPLSYTETETETEYPSSNSVEYRLAERLFKNIEKNNPKAKPPNLKSWAGHIEKAMRLDSRTVEELETIIDWSQRDSFWSGNILSTKTLREKYDQLYVKMKNGNGRPSSRNKDSPAYQFPECSACGAKASNIIRGEQCPQCGGTA